MPKATLIRLPKIKTGLMEGKTYAEIGGECDVTLKTIYRDVQVWTQTPDFDQWLDAEWVRLKTKAEREDFMEVFRQLTKLKAKRITQKFEAKTEVTERLEARIHLDVTEDEDRILNRAASILDKKLRAKTKPQSIH
jgi:hypothetical protein